MSNKVDSFPSDGDVTAWRRKRAEGQGSRSPNCGGGRRKKSRRARGVVWTTEKLEPASQPDIKQFWLFAGMSCPNMQYTISKYATHAHTYTCQQQLSHWEVDLLLALIAPERNLMSKSHFNFKRSRLDLI